MLGSCVCTNTRQVQHLSDSRQSKTRQGSSISLLQLLCEDLKPAGFQVSKGHERATPAPKLYWVALIIFTQVKQPPAGQQGAGSGTPQQAAAF